MGGKRGFEARISLATLDRLEHRRLLAADVRARPEDALHLEVEPAAEDVLADVPGLTRFVDGLLHPLHRAVAELSAAVHVREVELDGVAADDETFDEQVGAAQQDLPILERPRLALVRVHHQVLGEARLLAHEGPLQAGGKSRPAAPAQVRLHHLVDDLLRLHLERLRKRLVSAAIAVSLERPALWLLPIRREQPAARHRFGSVLPASGRVVTAGWPNVPVACGALCDSMRACGSGTRGAGPLAIVFPG